MLRHRTRRSPIGVEFGHGAIRLLQIEWKDGEGHVAASATVAPPDGEATAYSESHAEAVRKTLRERGFRGSAAVASLPGPMLIQRHVRVDEISGQGLHDALLFEVEDAFPGDVPVVQHVEVGEVMERGERRHEVILFAAGLSNVERTVRFLESAELAPLALDAEACALIRCFTRRRRRAADSDFHIAVIHVGEDATQASISGADQPLFAKALPVGTDRLFLTLQQRLDLSRDDLAAMATGGAEGAPEGTDNAALEQDIVTALTADIDSLSQELAACLRYHAASRRSPNGIDLFLCGPGAEVPGLATALSERIGATLHRPDPFSLAFSGVSAPGSIGQQYARWCIPLGLALREVTA